MVGYKLQSPGFGVINTQATLPLLNKDISNYFHLEDTPSLKTTSQQVSWPLPFVYYFPVLFFSVFFFLPLFHFSLFRQPVLSSTSHTPMQYVFLRVYCILLCPCIISLLFFLISLLRSSTSSLTLFSLPFSFQFAEHPSHRHSHITSITSHHAYHP